MAEGLKLVVSGDVTKAEKAIKGLTQTAAKEGTKAGEALATGLNKSNKAITNITNNAKPAIAKISELGKSVEALQFAIKDRQAEFIRTTDITRAAELNVQIKELQGEIQRIQRAGTTGFDNLGNQVAKTSGAFGAAAEGGKKLFSSLRFIANIIPGIGLAGLIGLLTDAVIGLFKASDGLDAAAVSAAKFTINIKEAEEGVKSFVDSLDFTADLDKLKNKLKLGTGDKLDVANFEVDKTKNQKIIDQADAEITELTDKILALRRDAAFVLSKKGQQLLDAFPVDLEIPDNLIDDLKSKDKRLLQELKVNATRIKTLEEARKKAFQENEKGAIEAQISAREHAKDEADKFFNQTVNEAKRLADFIQKKTSFTAAFDVDPFDSKAQTLQKAKEFINKAKTFFQQGTSAAGVFEFKPLVRVDFEFIQDKARFIRDVTTETTKTYEEAKKAFEENIKRLAATNPIVIETNAKIKTALEREGLRNKSNNDLFKSLGGGLFNLPENPKDSNGNEIFTKIEQQSREAAAAINQTLAPAFDSLFAAIKAGENPLQAFFKGLAQSIEQLIQKIIQAAIEAAILSAILPGGVGGVKGFGSIFKSILGFASGGIVSGPTLGLIGEGIGTNKSNPEVVAPLDQLKGILAGLAPSQGVNGNLSATIRGNNILLSNNRTNRQNRRLGAG